MSGHTAPCVGRCSDSGKESCMELVRTLPYSGPHSVAGLQFDSARKRSARSPDSSFKCSSSSLSRVSKRSGINGAMMTSGLSTRIVSPTAMSRVANSKYPHANTRDGRLRNVVGTRERRWRVQRPNVVVLWHRFEHVPKAEPEAHCWHTATKNLAEADGILGTPGMLPGSNAVSELFRGRSCHFFLELWIVPHISDKTCKIVPSSRIRGAKRRICEVRR